MRVLMGSAANNFVMIVPGTSNRTANFKARLQHAYWLIQQVSSVRTRLQHAAAVIELPVLVQC